MYEGFEDVREEFAAPRRRFAFPSGVGASPENGRLAESGLRAASGV